MILPFQCTGHYISVPNSSKSIRSIKFIKKKKINKSYLSPFGYVNDCTHKKSSLIKEFNTVTKTGCEE